MHARGESLDRIGLTLRKDGHAGDVVAAALTQVQLREKAAAKFGDAAKNMLFTQAGLEQASRDVVAREHAARFVRAGATSVSDLGCGLGAESLAFLNAGMNVRAVEIDPFTAKLAAHNLSAAGARASHEVITGDAELLGPGGSDAAFFDPARRTAGHRDTRRIASPDDYSPSLTNAFSVASTLPTGIKLGPGFERELIPEEAEAQWVSVNGSVVETALWFGATRSGENRRSALLFSDRGAAIERNELSAPADSLDAGISGVREYLYEPDGAVIRARLIGLLAERLDATMLDEHIAYMVADHLTPTPFASAFRVIDELPSKEKQLKRALTELDVGTVEIKKRGVAVDPAELRKRLKLKGSQSATIVMTRIGERHVTFLVERVPTH
ncbi:SAM-dependent methyltransferase [Leucobacter sp. UCMA 4100]|nr:SAM-dependent methyltransferase [Leucobacter sp. UCMA 4100]